MQIYTVLLNGHSVIHLFSIYGVLGNYAIHSRCNGEKKKRERETNIVPVPMYMLVGEIDSKEMRRQIYKIVASFSECYERNGKLC